MKHAYAAVRMSKGVSTTTTTTTTHYSSIITNAFFNAAAHSNALKLGILSDLHVATRLLKVYSNLDTFNDARQLFDEISASSLSRLDVVCWNSIISGSVQNGRDDEAFVYFKRMQHHYYSEDDDDVIITPDSFTFSTLLSSVYCLRRNVFVGEQLHGFSLKNGSLSGLSVQNALISLYAKWGRLSESKLVFYSMVVKNTVSWTALISTLAQQRGHEKESLRVFIDMIRDGQARPNQYTLSSIFSSCARLSSSQGMVFVTIVLKIGFLSDINVQNSLVVFYAEHGLLEEAKAVFESITKPDRVSWNSLLKVYSQHGRGKEALQVFKEMQRFVTPDSIALLSTLSACRHTGLVEEGMELFSKMKLKYGIEPQPEHISCMVDLLGRAGKLHEAKEFIRGVGFEEVEASVWRTILGACRVHGESGELAEIAVSKLLELSPCDSEFRAVLSNIYAMSGQWDEFTNLRRSFKEKGMEKEPGFSWIELGNMVHSFVSSDWDHPMIKVIQKTLMQLTDHIKMRHTGKSFM